MTSEMPSRVVVISTVHRPDDNRIYYKECASLAAAGYEVILVTTGVTRPIQVAGVRDVWLKRPRSRLVRMTVTALQAALVAIRLKPAVVHLHDPELLLVAPLLRAFGLRVVYDVHEDVPDSVAYKTYVPKWLRAPLRSVVNAVELQLARCATLIVVATPHIAERFGAMSRAAVVVQNYPRLAEMSAEVERRLPHGFEVTYVGAISKARGVFNMIEAVSCVEGEIAFNLGGHFESKAIEEKVRASAAGRPIRCLGFLDREQVRDVLSRSSCGFVLFEPERNYLLCYPTKMFEYMAAGVPVIASDFPLWRSIVEECGCGLLVPPHEPREVARALATLRDDPVAAAEMGMRGRRAVIETLNWERESAKLIEAYRRILPAQA